MPEEFVAELGRAGLSIERPYGAQRFVAQSPPENLEALLALAKRGLVWRELLLATCDHPNVVPTSDHLIAVARCT